MLDSAKIRALLPPRTNVKVSRPECWTGRRPSISVVIPCYNYGQYITECVRSVLDQSDVHVQVLVIDDASTDGSADVVASLPSLDKRVQVICRRHNIGHIATYNEGISKSESDYTVMLSADDMLTPGSLSRATALMEQNPTVGMTYGRTVAFRDSNLPIARSQATAWITWKGTDWISYRCKAVYNPLRSPEAVMRTSIMHEIGYYRPDLPHAADLELWLRFATVADIGYVAGADQAYYRIHHNNMHSSWFDMTSDLAQRQSCFDSIFTNYPGIQLDTDTLRETARRSLAREALGRAIMARTSEAEGQELVKRYIEFAAEAFSSYQHLPEWKTLSRIQHVSRAQWRPPYGLMRHRVASSIGYRMRRLRTDLVGI
jgi:glycosyltransferase involved in cell wall biosynthesis